MEVFMGYDVETTCRIASLEAYRSDSIVWREVPKEQKMSLDVKFQKARINAIVPSKREGDAGYDLYAAIDSDFLDEHCGIIKNGSFLPIRAIGDIMTGTEEILVA